jgi:hypothetical protein
MSMNIPLRCAYCDDVIGVYEPLIALVDGQPHETSRAVGRDTGAPSEACYHRGCYARRVDDPNR